ncbi:MAG: beta galactosidase jelly roll domain-containing protein [Clostridia bacterium]|nr:beta galactosidase jelly roll domain-containing protein [Clostridia bacterium]
MIDISDNNVLRLDSGWKILHDPDNKGIAGGWFREFPCGEGKNAFVPGLSHQFYYNEKGIFWYGTRFKGEPILTEGYRLRLFVGSANFRAEVYLNGCFLGSHTGPEEPFSFDVTDVFLPGKDNFLALRISKPYGDTEVDGYVFSQVPHRNELASGRLEPGYCQNECGITGSVYIEKVPEVRICDVFSAGNIEGSCVDVSLEIESLRDGTEAEITATVGFKRTGAQICEKTYKITAARGTNKLSMSLPVREPKLWSVDDPFLYYVGLRLRTETSNGVATCQNLYKTVGFRDLRVGDDGFFRLNGKRIFIRCSHTGNAFPYSTHGIPMSPELMRKDLYMAKSMGLNMVRFIAGLPREEQLDLADELGLMIYEEPLCAWNTCNGLHSEELYTQGVFSMIKRDRSHPSVAIWGLLNETVSTPPVNECFDYAKNILPELRKLDGTRLVLLNSGRFDGYPETGSVSNPGSLSWECLWNDEGRVPGHFFFKPSFPPGYIDHVGDVHMYPALPMSAKDRELIMNLGKEAKRPVFLSETGCGSLLDVVRLCKIFTQEGADRDLPDVYQCNLIRDRFLELLSKYSFDREYAFPDDIMERSYELHARQRQFFLDVIRSDPYICGYSATGLLDHSICGEGLFTLTREWKKGIADVFSNGLAPLKWCIIPEKTHLYSGENFNLRVFLANEDVLTESSYHVFLKIIGGEGIVYERSGVLTLTDVDLRLLSVKVFDIDVCLPVPTGEYEIRCSMESAAPTDSHVKIYITDPSDFRPEPGSLRVYTFGLPENVLTTLKNNNVTCVPLSLDEPDCVSSELFVKDPAPVLVGSVLSDLYELKEKLWSRLTAAASCGLSVIILDKDAMAGPDGALQYLPVEGKPSLGFYSDWLYHREYMARRGHPYYKGLPTGMMDWEYWPGITVGFDLRDGDVPCDTAGISFITGAHAGLFQGGLTLGSYKFGKGRFVLNTLRIMENAGVCPAADRLLINIIRAEKTGKS